MIKIENVVLASPMQMMFIIQGMRNSFNSWNKSDTFITGRFSSGTVSFLLGKNDRALMKSLANADSSERKFLRMMPVYVRVTAPLYWWKEADTYKVGTVSNSCSTMHKITAKEFTMDDFSHEHVVSTIPLETVISDLNSFRHLYLECGKNKEIDSETADNYKRIAWYSLIQNLPSSYNQTRNLMLNYEVLRTIYKQRRYHKLDEWREFCDWIETLPYAEDLLIPEGK